MLPGIRLSYFVAGHAAAVSILIIWLKRIHSSAPARIQRKSMKIAGGDGDNSNNPFGQTHAQQTIVYWIV